MGETSLGKIKKFNNAWTNMFEEIGEKATNFWSRVLDETKAKEAVDKITKTLEQINARDLFQKVVNIEGVEGLSLDVIQKLIPLNELRAALTGVESEIDKYKKILGEDMTEEGLSFQLAPLLEEEQAIKDFISKFLDDANWKAYDEAMEKLYGKGKNREMSADALKWLEALRKAEAQKRGLLNLDEIGVKFENQRFARAEEVLSLEEEAVKLGADKAEVHALLLKYSNLFYANLKEEESITRNIIADKERQKILEEQIAIASERKGLTSKYGTKQQQDLITYIDELNNLKKALMTGAISYERYIELTDKLDKNLSPKTGMGSFMEGLIGDFADADRAGERFLSTMEAIGGQVLSAGVDALTSSLTYLGASMAGLGEGADSWETTMLKIIASSLSAIGPNLMLAGALQLAQGNLILGFSLLAAGGAATIGGGYLSQAISNVEGGGTTDSSPNSTAINTTDVYSPSEYDPSSSRGMEVQNNIVNYTSANVTTSSKNINGRAVTEIFIDNAVNSTANKYNLKVAPKYVS